MKPPELTTPTAPTPTPEPTPEPEQVKEPHLAAVIADSVPDLEPPVVHATGGFGISDEEFQKRVEVVMKAIEDPEKFRRCLAEVHTLLFMFEQGFREMQTAMIEGGGPMAMFRKMFMGR